MESAWSNNTSRKLFTYDDHRFLCCANLTVVFGLCRRDQVAIVPFVHICIYLYSTHVGLNTILSTQQRA